MKRCKNGHTYHDDNLSFCTICGAPLESVVESSAPDEKEKSDKKAPKKKSGCLKSVLICCGIILMGIWGFINYVNNAASYIRVEPEELYVPKKGGKCKIEIDYDGYIWNVNHNPDWTTILEYDDDFVVNIMPNTSGQQREGSITIQSGKHLAQVVIHQLSVATEIKVSKSTIKFGRKRDSENFSVETDGCNFEVEYPNWLNVTIDGDDVLVECNTNSDDYRTGVIKVSEDKVYSLVSVSQAGKCTTCHGEGMMTCTFCFGLGGLGYGMYRSTCLSCNGTGRISCRRCDGSGYIE